MTRLFDHRLTPETLCLGVVDSLLCFLVVYLLCSSAPSPGLIMAGPLQPEVAKAAASIALATAVLAFGIGLYRPEMYLQTRRLLINTAVGGGVGEPARRRSVS